MKCSRLLRFASRPSVKLLKAVIGICTPLAAQYGGVAAIFSRGPPALAALEDRNSRCQSRTSTFRLSFPKPRNTCHDLLCRRSLSIHRCRSSRPCHLTSPFPLWSPSSSHSSRSQLDPSREHESRPWSLRPLDSAGEHSRRRKKRTRSCRGLSRPPLSTIAHQRHEHPVRQRLYCRRPKQSRQTPMEAEQRKLL